MAKQRALDFGRTDVVHAVEESHGSISDEYLSESSTIVVRSTVSEDEMFGKKHLPTEGLETKARGFFADQFEVILYTILMVGHV